MKPATAPARTALMLVAVVAVMASLSFAAVPMYNWFCKVTGFAGTTQVAARGSDGVLDRTITVGFDASLERGMPWQFKSLQSDVELRIGETGLAFYEAYNPTDKPVVGQASYNVAPFKAGPYFVKIACFCFTQQVLQPHERVQMPVTFYIDPAIVNDPEAKNLKHITLSYTFHEAKLPEEQASLTQAETTPVN